MLLCAIILLVTSTMGYSSDTLLNIGFRSNTSLPSDCYDRIDDLGLQRNIRSTHRDTRNVIHKSQQTTNQSSNIGLSIDVRVTQRPDLHQRPIYRPNQLISTRETFSDSNERAFRYDIGFDGMPLDNLTPISEEKMIQIIKSP